MRDTCVFSQLLGRVVLLFLTTMLFTSLLAAQDFQIMVNGPWDYVLDPHREYDHNSTTPSDDRIVLVAPSTNHWAYIFPGPNAGDEKMMSDSNSIQASAQDSLFLYYLDFSKPVQNGANGEPNEEPAQLYAPTQIVSDQTIANVFYTYDSTTPRYAVSLPMPDYIETYTGNYGTGFAESKIKVGKLTNKTQPKEYTIWMVLHYSVTAIPATMLVSNLVKGISVIQDKPVTVTSAGGRSAISITLMDPTKTTDLECDPLSGYSFGASMKMWGLTEHARFPVQKDLVGTQYPGYYDYTCAEAHQSSLVLLQNRLDKIKSERKTATQDIEVLKKDLSSILLETRAAAITTPNSQLEDWKKVNEDLNSLLGHPPQTVTDALSCSKDLVDGKGPDEFCPEHGSQTELLHKLFQYNTLSAVGSTDCHKAQISINNAFKDIL
jgi:hypothetical protein